MTIIVVLLVVRDTGFISGTSRVSKSGCSEQYGVRGKCEAARPGLRLCRCHMPSPEASERAAGAACQVPGRAA